MRRADMSIPGTALVGLDVLLITAGRNQHLVTQASRANVQACRVAGGINGGFRFHTGPGTVVAKF